MFMGLQNRQSCFVKKRTRKCPGVKVYASVCDTVRTGVTHRESTETRSEPKASHRGIDKRVF